MEPRGCELNREAGIELRKERRITTMQGSRWTAILSGVVVLMASILPPGNLEASKSLSCGWEVDCYICYYYGPDCAAVNWSCANGDSGYWINCSPQ